MTTSSHDQPNPPSSLNLLRKRPGAIAGLVVVLLLVILQWPLLRGTIQRVTGSEAPPSAVPWRSDFSAAMVDAGRSSKTLFVDFTASWCPPCQAMKHDVWPDAKVGQIASASFIPVQIDVDRDPETAAKYQINSIPTLLIVDAKGQIIRRSEGYLSADQVIEFLKK